MKKTAMLLLALTLLPLSAHADYQSTMKAMGKDFKALGIEAQKGAFQSDALGIAQDLVNLIQNVQTETPDSDVLDPAAPDYATKKADMDRLLSQLLTQAQALVAALQNNDQTAALKALSDMSATKKEGHDGYKPPN